MINSSFKTTTTLIFLLTLITLISGCSVFHSSVQEDLEVLKQNDEKISEQLADIQKTLETLKPPKRKKPQPFKPQDISIKDIQFLGKHDAAITLIEFTDYHCPFCRRHAKNTTPLIIKDYVDTGKIRYGISELPLVKLHPQSFKLAKATICGGRQGKYWAMHDLFFEKKVTDVMATAKSAKLDMQKFNNCMANKSTEHLVKDSIATAGKLGIRGTPGFVLGKTNSKTTTTLHVEKSLRGALPYSKFQAVIDKMLKEK